MVSLGPLFVAKCLLLFGYYALLNRLGLGGSMLYKFVTFNTSSAAVKYVRFFKKNASQLPYSQARAFAVSFLIDLINSICYFGVFFPCTYGGPMLFAWLSAPLVLLPELVKHRILEPHSEYKIITSPSLAGNLSMFFLAMLNYYLVGVHLDYNQPFVDNWLFPVFVFFVMGFDLVFGLSHYLEHKVPWMWEKHKFHHQYKKEQLNIFATFCADFEDAATMQIGTFLAGMFVMWTGRYWIAFLDLLLSLTGTHARYGGDLLNLVYFFEWDLIDICFAAEEDRISCYHRNHHMEPDKNFAIFGIFPDHAVASLASPLLRMAGGSKDAEGGAKGPREEKNA